MGGYEGVNDMRGRCEWYGGVREGVDDVRGRCEEEYRYVWEVMRVWMI